MDSFGSEVSKAIKPQQEALEAHWLATKLEFVELSGMTEAQVVRSAKKKYPDYDSEVAVQIFIADFFYTASAEVWDAAPNQNFLPATDDD